MSAYVSGELRRQVCEWFSSCCAYCQTSQELSAATFEIEHIVPRSAGGATTFVNLCFACPTCNRCKGDRTAAIHPATNEPTLLFHPHQDSWRAHFLWNEDSTQIVATSVKGEVTIHALRMNRPALVRLRRMWVAMGKHPPERSQET